MMSVQTDGNQRARGLLVAALVAFHTPWALGASMPAFQYPPIAEPIVSATFNVDFASLTAHRMVFGYETNFVHLVDVHTGLADLDLSDALFGTVAFPDPPLVDMGPVQTAVLSAPIDPWFYPALQSGEVGLVALFTDTGDGLFAIDFVSLTIETASTTVEAFYGWPVGNENDGYGLGIPDGGDLPAPMPGVLSPTGTGFDEEITSKSIYAVPEPSVLALLVAGILLGRQRSSA